MIPSGPQRPCCCGNRCPSVTLGSSAASPAVILCPLIALSLAWLLGVSIRHLAAAVVALRLRWALLLPLPLRPLLAPSLGSSGFQGPPGCSCCCPSITLGSFAAAVAAASQPAPRSLPRLAPWDVWRPCSCCSCCPSVTLGSCPYRLGGGEGCGHATVTTNIFVCSVILCTA